jgi:hypothetical protein
MSESHITTNYRDPDIPAPLGDQLREALALEERPGTASPVLAYERIRSYGHAFASPEAYEAWAADVGALTMQVRTADTLQLAKALGRRA